MRRNLSTLLAVFAVIFALAFLLNRGKVRSAQPAPDVQRAGQTLPPPSDRVSSDPDHAPASEIADEVEAPATDSIPRNPPSAILFGSGGRFQLYRQGDLTWRLDTQTGRTCILFATDDQWSNLRVYQHGCGATY